MNMLNTPQYSGTPQYDSEMNYNMPTFLGASAIPSKDQLDEHSPVVTNGDPAAFDEDVTVDIIVNIDEHDEQVVGEVDIQVMEVTAHNIPAEAEGSSTREPSPKRQIRTTPAFLEPSPAFDWTRSRSHSSDARDTITTRSDPTPTRSNTRTTTLEQELKNKNERIS